MKKDVRIVVFPYGWVFVGQWEDHAEEIFLHHSFCIRQWGTKNGLGQLALQGPTPNTVLDPAGVVRFLKESPVLAIQCDEAKWKKQL